MSIVSPIPVLVDLLLVRTVVASMVPAITRKTGLLVRLRCRHPMHRARRRAIGWLRATHCSACSARCHARDWTTAYAHTEDRNGPMLIKVTSTRSGCTEVVVVRTDDSVATVRSELRRSLRTSEAPDTLDCALQKVEGIPSDALLRCSSGPGQLQQLGLPPAHPPILRSGTIEPHCGLRGTWWSSNCTTKEPSS